MLCYGMSPLHAGLRMELNGVPYGNNSEIAITEVGEGFNALQCRTDLATCCSTLQLGEWHYPNNSLVGGRKSGDDIYRTRGNMSVSLNRRNGVTQPTGLYCCEMPTAADPNTNATICITLLLVSKHIKWEVAFMHWYLARMWFFFPRPADIMPLHRFLLLPQWLPHLIFSHL